MSSAPGFSRPLTRECPTENEGYSAVVLSSLTEIQNFRLSAKDSPLQNDILRYSQLYLALLPEEWTPKLICVRHGNQLVGVVCAKDREIVGSSHIWYADFSLGSTMLGDSIEQQAIFLLALETMLARAGTRGIRISVRPLGPELAAVRRLVASKGLNCRVWSQDGHAVLSLPSTYQELLSSFGGTTRRNFRYYRRRFETRGHMYLENLSMEELRLAVAYLRPKCNKAGLSDPFRFLNAAAFADRPLVVGLRHRNGEWLSVICGVYTEDATAVLLLQLNNDRDFPRDSLSVVSRAYLIESLIHRGMKDLVVWDGTAPPLNRYVTHINTVGISIDSPDYKWSLVRTLKSVLLPWLPGGLKRWVAC